MRRVYQVWMAMLCIAGETIAWSAGVREVESSYQIRVDAGPFANADEAASSEGQINWQGGDVAAMRACTESFAAVELRNYLRKLVTGPSGAPRGFMIVPLRGAIRNQSIILASMATRPMHPGVADVIARENLAQKLKHQDSFALVPRNENLFIIGADRTGTLYGVYAFLEAQGVRWYGPGEAGEVIRSGGRLKLPDRVVIERPSFLTRGFWIPRVRGDREFYLWMARNRLNLWGVDGPDHPLLKKLGIQLTAGGHSILPRFLNPEDTYPYRHPRVPGNESGPPDPYHIDQVNFQGDADGDGRLTYVEAHPEWYGMRNGKRDAFRGFVGTNPCTSNDDMVSELTKKLVLDLEEGRWRAADVLNLWMLDGGIWCECNRCSVLGEPTDRMLRLAHQVRKAIASAKARGVLKRDIQVVFPIYHETLPPPTRPLPDGFDYENCIGTFFPITRCFRHQIDDPTCTESNSQAWSHMSGWVKGPRYYKGSFVIGEYYNVSGLRSLPVLHTRTMPHDIALYHSMGARHAHYMHVYTGFQGPKRLNNYVWARLLWNHQEATAPLLNSYFRDYYEDAASRMAAFYGEMESAMACAKQWPSLRTRILRNQEPEASAHVKVFRTPPTAQNDGVSLEETAARLRECRRILGGVLSKPVSHRVRERLLEDEQNLRYAENVALLYFYLAQSTMKKRAGDLEAARQLYLKTTTYAQGLQMEMDIGLFSEQWVNFRDGLQGTLGSAEYRRLGTELGIGK